MYKYFNLKNKKPNDIIGMVIQSGSLKIPSLPVLPRKPSKQKIKTWKFAGRYLWKSKTVKDQGELGRWTCNELIKLGPTFVKLGQIASSRGDLFQPEFTRELESLQDAVPAMPVEGMVDMGDFEEFDLKPYKSASIGQVHRARLKTGKDIVVKIKRPNIYEILKTDTDNVLEIVRFLEWIGIDTGTGTGIALEESVDYLLGEADYEQEIDNAVKFRKGMKGVSWIKVPKVYKNLSNQDRIVMEYVESTKVTELTNKKINKKKVCEAIINSYLIQTMDKGFFHGDPHPGNLGISEKTGKLVFYDFGLLIIISERLRQGFTNILVHIINKDTTAIVNELVEMGVIVPTSSELTDIAAFFRSILNYLETLDGGVIVNDDFAAQLAQEKPFTVPSSFIYLAKSFSIIEGICKELDPDFNYFTYLEPMIQDEIEDAISLGEMISTTTEMPSRVRDISTAVLGLEKSRAQMKRMMNKTGREVRFAQYSILVSILAAQTEHTALTILCVATSIWLTMSSQK
tara:strand:+ start:2484 stop:4025 length:1542 start_codon:yes stop_codon:yes gene_type:complete